MKPLNFIFPSSWNRKDPLLVDDIVYFLPKTYLLSDDRNYYSSFRDILLRLSFGRPVCCELCSGNGDWIIEQAQKKTGYFWIAVEKCLDRIKKIWSKNSNYGLNNLLLVYGEAFSFFQKCIPNETIQNIFVNFPDPWPKKRHVKNRLISSMFVREAVRILENSGKISLITDDFDFLEYSIHFLHKDLTSCFPFPYYELREESFGQSWFEQLWRKKEKEIYYSEFSKSP